jgi:formamidopyrimidine-DNA glycosylase
LPELPEVETIVRRLRQPLIGRTITKVTYDWPRTIGRPAPKEFRRRVPGLTFRSIDRRAKYLVFTVGQDGILSRQVANPSAPLKAGLAYILIHLKMSGRLNIVLNAEPISKHDRVIFDLDNGKQLRFNDVRKFGRVYLVADPAEITGRHGPEPLDSTFTLKKFREMVRSRSGAIKPLLLNQNFLAGVGNIYADESLWSARIHPLRKVDSLKEAEVAALYRSIRKILKRAIDDQGTDAGDGVIEMGDYEPRVYGREGQACKRCGHIIHKMWVGQRGTHYCPHCQVKRGQ